MRHRHPLGGHRVVRLAARRRGRGQPARPDPHRRDAARPRRHAASRRGVDLLRRRQPPRRRARAARAATARSSSTSTGAREVAAAPAAPARRRRREPQPRAAHAASAAGARAELGAAGTPALADKTEQLRPRWVSDRWSKPGRSRATSLGWPDAYAYTKALGERALHRDDGRRARQHRAPVDHRVGARRAATGLDPRLPHGRAGDHLLRPRPAEGVPGRARGRRRRHPRRPRRRRDLRRRRARAPIERRPIVQVGVGLDEPVALPPPRRPRARLVQRAPAVRQRRPADRRAEVVVPRPRQGAGPAATEPSARSNGPRRRSRCSRCAGEAAEVPARLEERRSDIERALSYVELYGAYAECEAIYGVDRLLELWDQLDDDDRASSRSTRGDRLDAVRHRGPPPVGRPARTGAHHTRRTQRPVARGHGCGAAVLVTRSPPRRVRPREHAHRVERRRVVRVAREPSARPTIGSGSS